MNRDYIFHINWDDRLKKSHRVGILAQIDELFYMIIKDEKNAEFAYKNGFVGVPGFKTEEVYRSSELFDFFKSRILEKNQKNLCEELAKTKGMSMIDSFSVEEVAQRTIPKYREVILQAYELQVKKSLAQEKNNTDKNMNKKDDSDEFHDIE